MGCRPDSEGKTVTAWNADIEQSHESPCMEEEDDLVHCWAECGAVSLQSSVLDLILKTHTLEESCSCNGV